MAQIQPPETFDFSTPNEWPKWRKRFERYLVVSGMKKKEEADKIDLFMYLLGDRADDIFRTFKFEKKEEATKIDSVLKAFDSHFCVRKNIIYERAKFNSRIQEDREPVDEFITSLYKLANSCEFEGLHDQLIRDRIVVGVRDKALSERMQLDSELTLEKAVKMVRQQEAVRQQQVDLQRPSTSQKKEKSAKTRSRCPECGGFTHREGQACRAEGQKCNLCSKTGHFANYCPDKQAKTAEVKAVFELDEEIGFLLEVSAVEDSSNLDDDEGECRRRWTAEIQVNGKKVKFKLDSQADVTCVPLCLFKKIMGQQRLVKSDINLRAAEFSELQTVGMFISTLRNGNYEIKEKIYVIRRLSEPLLSRRACELFNLARRIEVVATRINPIKEFPKRREGGEVLIVRWIVDFLKVGYLPKAGNGDVLDCFRELYHDVRGCGWHVVGATIFRVVSDVELGLHKRTRHVGCHNRDGKRRSVTLAARIQPPETFDFSTPNEWPKWRKRFERYLVVSGMKKKEEADKIDLFMYLLGDRADDIFRTFKFEKKEEATKIDSVLKAFDSHFCVRKNIIYERAKFNSRIQEDREPVDEFITSLYKLANSCEFEGLHDQLIRDRIVVGVRDKALSERMQLDSELTLEKAVKMVRQQEAVRQQQVDLQRPSTSQKKEKSAKTRSRCPECGGFTHREGQACRAEGQKCNLCSKTGHFANYCPDKQAKTAEVKAVFELDEEIGFLLEVSAVEDSSNLDDDEGECRRRWTAEIQVNGKKVKFKLDSQADVTCVPLCLFKKIMGQQRLVKSDINLRAAEFSELQTVGMFISTLRNGNYEIKEKIYVIRRLSEPLLSRRACELFNLARRIEVVATRINPIKEFPKLEELEKAGIIAQVNVATEWCAPTVIVGKPNGDIRLCVDLSRLNEHVQREVHPMPVVEHMLGQLGEARFFSKLDANSGFHQIPLSPDCQHLTTFITPFGRYKYCRMPFGISLAPEYFQRVMSIILQGMDGVMCYLDDILIFASDSKTHDRILRLVLRKLKEAKVTLNKAKCVFGVPRINFLGHILDEDGIRPDPAKIEAVAKMPAPTDVHGVRRFLGMVNHLGRFVENLSEIVAPLNQLLVKGQDFVWDCSQERAFRKLKELLTTQPILAAYDVRKPTMVSSDASSYGLGAVLKQEDEMLTKIFEAQQEDTTLKAVVNYLEQGWPDKKKMSQALLSYWHVKDELGVQNGLLMRSCRLVIPASMKLEILDKLHAGHFGITKTRLRARETVWWPGISKEIAETVRKCSVCIQEAVSKHEPLIPTNFPTRPWQKIGMDLFKFENKWYLVVIDYYSRFPEMIQLDRLTANVVVRSCKSIFSRHGIPETVVSDNGTQFGAAREFANSARQYGFTHVTSSPRFPQSNGMAEAGVKIAKLILKKNQDPSLGLLEYRSTLLENGYSPAELLMGRKLRTTLPIAPENLNPKLVDSQTLKRKEGRRRKDMKSRYDRRCGATDMEELSEGDTVWITDMRTWGIVKQKASTPRSYLVDTPVGTLPRNRFHLRKGVTVQYPADPSTPTFSGEELVENEKTPVVDYPSNDSEDGQIRTRSGRIVKPVDRLHY
ncbi:K02A2.6-like [Cordylochernes scorpioides]|uniref:RNA-directed DNA polymerase n=1 Tax=Cordylochernes scorpioides TaxID=51811 RepID=A0ABY6K318_9ARAC|nr:K02A2.6-like [Cordylochernes scorpioides]